MTWHPTTNLIQTDLLTREQRKALEVWPHGHEFHIGNGEWEDGTPIWTEDCVYRGKPEPVVTSVWYNVCRNGLYGSHRTRDGADKSSLPNRIDVLRIDTCNGVSTAHLEGKP